MVKYMYLLMEGRSIKKFESYSDHSRILSFIVPFISIQQAYIKNNIVSTR